MSEIADAIQQKCLAFSDRIIKLRSALPLATVGTQERLLTRYTVMATWTINNIHQYMVIVRNLLRSSFIAAKS